MSRTTKEQREVLREAAAHATPGPWHQSGYVHAMGWGVDSELCNEEAPLVCENAAKTDAAYIAAANPAVVLALLEDLKEAEERAAYLADLDHGEWCNEPWKCGQSKWCRMHEVESVERRARWERVARTYRKRWLQESENHYMASGEASAWEERARKAEGALKGVAGAWRALFEGQDHIAKRFPRLGEALLDLARLA